MSVPNTYLRPNSVFAEKYLGPRLEEEQVNFNCNKMQCIETKCKCRVTRVRGEA
jgi:hypothetical protein